VKLGLSIYPKERIYKIVEENTQTYEKGNDRKLKKITIPTTL
jgi:hypothetical protein